MLKNKVNNLNFKNLAFNFSQSASFLGRIRGTSPKIPSPASDYSSTPRSSKNNSFAKQFNNIVSNYKTVILVVAILAMAVIAILIISGNRPDQAISRQLAQQTLNIGKTFEFPIRGADGKTIDNNLKMILTTAEKTNQILIKGQPATARTGKLFLILNIELDNPTNNQLSLSPVELIRLVDSSDRRFAPDVHNDEVKIEPISIKRTRVGFVVNQSDKQFKIQVGEVSGEKQTFDLVI